jgi:Carboxypeptidase regulatory-like domain
MEPGEGVLVTLSSDLGSVEGAVLHQGLFLGQMQEDGQSADPRACRGLLRSYVFGAEGRVVACPLPGRQGLAASLGETRSAPWFGESPASAELKLRGVFVVEGHVSASTSMEIESCRLVSRAYHSGFISVLDERQVAGDGTWDPVTLPVLPVSQYGIRLEGATYVPQEVLVTAPRPGSRIPVDFVLEQGFPIPARVVDASGAGIASAHVTVYWQDEGAWMESTATANEDGDARLDGCPAGELWLRAYGDGYTTKLLDPMLLDSEPVEPILIELDRAGRIVGTCSFNDSPVEDFVVEYWSTGTTQIDDMDVRSSQDGSFKLLSAPLGTVGLLAFSSEHARSEPVFVEVTQDGVTQVSLELGLSLPGTGRVIDGMTQEPITNASVQLWNTAGRTWICPWGPAVSVDSEGRFELSGCREGENWITVSSSDHSERTFLGIGSGDVADFGYVPLFSTQDLRFKLEAEQPMDLEACKVGLTGEKYVPDKPLDADGEAVIPGLPPGDYHLTVTLEDTRPLTSDITLRPGDDWYVEFPVPDRDPVHAQVIPAPGEELPPMNMEISYRWENGTDIRYLIGVSPEGQAAFFRPPSETATLDLYGEAGLLASKQIRPREVDAPVEIYLGAAPRTFRIVDSEGEPVPGVTVRLNLPQDDSGWYAWEKTDGEGTCTFTGLLHDTVLVSLFHPSRGVRPLIPVQLAGLGDEVIELELDASLELAVRLVDGDVPLAGIPVRLTDELGLGTSLGDPSSDGNGVAAYRPVAEGRYLARVTHPGLWETQQVVEPGPSPTPIQVRRLGSVVIDVRRGAGGVPGARVELRSVEFGTDVAGWVEQGRVRVSTPGGVTDGAGQVSFEGLPHGSYAWRVDLGGGDVREGTLTVPPAQRLHVPLDLS